MRIQLAATIRKYDKKNFSKDILAGIIIMAVSIPIAMGYAQIAGLPGSLWSVWFHFPNSDICTVFDFTTVYFWRRCGTGSLNRFGTGGTWY